MGNLRLLGFFGGAEKVQWFFPLLSLFFPRSVLIQLIQHTDGITELGRSVCKARSKMQDNALRGTELFLKDSIQKIA